MRYDRKFLFSLLAVGFWLSCTWVAPQIAIAEIPEHILEKVKNATVRIETDRGWGSGFFVESDKIVTNIHVIQGYQGVLAMGVKDTPYCIEGVIISDPEHDVVILKMSGKGKPLELSEGQIEEQIFAAGYPADKAKEYVLEEGTIRYIWNKGKQLRWEHNGAFMEGMSGGAVVNSIGEVVGIAVSAHWGGDSVTGQKLPPFFGNGASASVLKKLLKKSESAEPMDLPTWNDKPCIRAYGLNKYGKNKMKIVKGEEEDAEKATLYNEAIKYFDEASKLCPKYAEAHFEFGMARWLRDKSNLSRDEFKVVIDSFTKVIKLNPDYYSAYFYRGVAHLQFGKNSRNGKEKQQHYNTAIIDFIEAIKRNKNDSAYYINRAVAKLDLAELETDKEKVFTFLYEAINDSTEAIRIDPEDVIYYKKRAAVKFHLGELGSQSGEGKIAHSMYDEVINDWTEVIKRDPSSADSIKLDPKTAYGYYVSGVLNLLRGQSKASENKMKEARQLYNVATDDFIKANDCIKTEKLDLDDADVYYDTAINVLNPDDADTCHVRAFMKSLRGQSRANQGGVAEARSHYQEAIKDYQEAIKRYGIAVEDNSIYIVSAYYNQGKAKVAIEDYNGDDGAIADFSKVIELKPDFAEACWERGLVYQKIGQEKKANADFKKAKELDPNVGK